MSKKTLLIVSNDVASDNSIKDLNDHDFAIVSGSEIETLDGTFDEIILNDKAVTDAQIYNVIYPNLLKSNGLFIDINKKTL